MAANGMPAFFQANTTTVLDELADYGHAPDPLGHSRTETFDMSAFEDSDAFGDLQADNLPAFFTDMDENYEFAMADAAAFLDDDVPAFPLPAGARATSLPPGLSKAARGPPATPPHYRDIMGAMGAPAPMPAPMPAPAPAVFVPPPPQLSMPMPAPMPMPVPVPMSAPAVPFSYARAVAPEAPQAPRLDVPNMPPPQPPQPMPMHMMPPPPHMMPQHMPMPMHMNMPPPQPPMPPHPNMGQYVLNTPMQGPTPGTNFAGSQGTFSAQRPLLFNSERGFSSTQSQGAKPPRKDLPKGKYMSPSDVRYIVNKVLQPMESTDPFAEDFYFLQLSIKKNSIAREAALAQQSPMPSSIYVPLPVWKETKERLRLQMDVTRKSFHDRSRQWESRERVLGHQVRTDIWRPREQLAMPRDEEPEIEEGTEGAVEGVGVGEEKAPFSSRLWTMRSAVQRGYEALYTVQELQHLLSSPLVASNPTAYQEIAREIDSAIALLSQSIGIRTTNGMGVGGAGMGMGGAGMGMGAGAGMGMDEEFTLDGAQVGAILQTTIGRKLMTRSFKLLLPPHRWALLPVILAKTLLSPPAEGAGAGGGTGGGNGAAGGDALGVEQRLLRTIIEFLQYSFQFHLEQLRLTPPGQVAPFASILTSNLRQCIQSVLLTQMERAKLRQALISERTRAEVMHVVVQIGDKAAPCADAGVAGEWHQTRGVFMAMLDA